MERIREAHRLLEASASRRAKLEATMREKLEQEIRKLKEDNVQQKGALQQMSHFCTRLPASSLKLKDEVGTKHTH